MARWSRGLIIVEVLLLAATGGLGYLGASLVTQGNSGERTLATIVSCHSVSTRNNQGPVCMGRWTVGDAANRRTVTGTVESATSADEGKTMEIVVAGGHGWKPDDATRMGYVFLGFAALLLTIAIALPLDRRRARSRGEVR
jgi:hypothetical protein